MSVGVLINNYNNGRWLREAVDSVLEQSRAPDEVIVYDDGSADDSLAILRGYGGRIRLIEGRHEDGRPGIVAQGAALAGAFALSTADHLYLLDGDDKFLPGKIAAYEAAWAARPEATLVQAPMVLADEAGVVLKDNYEANKHQPDHRRATYAQQDTDLYYATSALAFHRSYLERELPLDYSILRDAPIDARLGPGAPFFGPVLTLAESFTWWRQRAGSISQGTGQRDPLTATRRRHRVFNDFARRNGFSPIRLGLNRRYYKQVARRLLPAWVSAPFVRNPEGRR
jgi:glycosyltransferase involved in cell wall biosynthesis